jgi:N-acetylglucosamine-6-phosphate deacetylase
MDRFVLAGATLLDPEADAARPGTLVIEDGRIAARLRPEAQPPSDARRVDLAGRFLAPGFLDLHYHGDLIFAAPDRVPERLRAAGARLLASGVTGFLPTTLAWPEPDLGLRVAAWGAAVAAQREPAEGAAALGLHLEGPWIRPEAAGAQPRRGIRPFRAGDASLLERAAGLTRMVTLAPEAEGADALLRELGARGVVAALGHSLADTAICERALAQGARHVTHLFNAMGAFHQRAPGLIGVALTDDRLSCDLICDGVHVHPSAVRLAARAKGPRLALITDHVDPTGESDSGNAFADSIGGPLRDDGIALRRPDGTLAGSRLSLDRAVANAVAWGALDRLAAVRAATLTPARILGLERERGTLRTGARADFAVLDEGGRVVETWLCGRPVYAG